MKSNTYYEDQCCTSGFKSEGTKNTECPSYALIFAMLVNTTFVELWQACPVYRSMISPAWVNAMRSNLPNVNGKKEV